MIAPPPMPRKELATPTGRWEYSRERALRQGLRERPAMMFWADRLTEMLVSPEGSTPALPLPEEARSDSRQESLEILSVLADRWGRPVSLADDDFAKAFSVQCVPAWIEIDATGREGEVHEYR